MSTDNFSFTQGEHVIHYFIVGNKDISDIDGFTWEMAAKDSGDVTVLEGGDGDPGDNNLTLAKATIVDNVDNPNKTLKLEIQSEVTRLIASGDLSYDVWRTNADNEAVLSSGIITVKSRVTVFESN